MGGKNILPMNELKTLMLELGYSNVATYIQSGNVIFCSPVEDITNLSLEIGNAINRRFGFLPRIFLLTAEEMQKAIAENPFPEAINKGSNLHLYFLSTQANAPDLDKLTSLQKGSERFALHDQVFYLHAPEGIGRSKMAANIEKSLNVPVTARNWNSVCKILDLAQQQGKSERIPG